MGIELLVEEIRSTSSLCLLSELAADNEVTGTALRHDVDHSWDAALDLALRLERLEVRSTFFLLPNAAYLDDRNDLLSLAITLGDLGHEVGLHLNLLADFAKGKIENPISELNEFMQILESAGNHCRLVASHGDQVCYQHGFANYWLWSDIYEKAIDETELRNAEGTLAQQKSERLRPSAIDTTHLPGDFRAFLGCVDFDMFNLLGEATFLPNCRYFSDSGGTWKRSVRPQRETLGSRNQILLHPEYWKLSDSTRTLVLSIPRSGSKWLSRRLRTTPGLVVTHDGIFGESDSSTGVANITSFGFGTRVDDDSLLSQRLLDRRELDDRVGARVVHVSTYGLFRLDLVAQILPDYRTIYLRRDLAKIAQSLMHRGWFAESEDHHHPRPRCYSTDEWRRFSQLERIVHFIVVADMELAAYCSKVLDLESISADSATFRDELLTLGLPYSARLDGSFGEVADARVLCEKECCRVWSTVDADKFSTLLANTKRDVEARLSALGGDAKPMYAAVTDGKKAPLEADVFRLATSAEASHTYETARKSSWRKPGRRAWRTRPGDVFRLQVESHESSSRASLRVLFFSTSGEYSARILLSVISGESRTFQITVPVGADKVDFALYEPKATDCQPNKKSSVTLSVELHRGGSLLPHLN